MFWVERPNPEEVSNPHEGLGVGEQFPEAVAALVGIASSQDWVSRKIIVRAEAPSLLSKDVQNCSEQR